MIRVFGREMLFFCLAGLASGGVGLALVALQRDFRPAARSLAPIVCLLSAVAGVLVGAFGASLSLALIAGLLVTTAAIDLKTFRIPDTLSAAVLVLAMATGPLTHVEALLGAALGGGLPLFARQAFLRVRSIDGLGLGDVKLMVGCGALVGVGGVGPVLLLSSLAALASFLCAGRLRRTANGTSGTDAEAMAFGPYIAGASGLVALFQGLAA